NGNHYLCDGAGLVFLGAFFRSTGKGQRWLTLGREIVHDEMFNQTTVDGVDFEKSTAYHRLVLEAFLTCGLPLDLHGDPLSCGWRRPRRSSRKRFRKADSTCSGRTGRTSSWIAAKSACAGAAAMVTTTF